MAGEFVTIKLAPAPIFSCGGGKPPLATIYASHYDRMQSVIAAARTGNRLLIKLALAHHDLHGSADVN